MRTLPITALVCTILLTGCGAVVTKQVSEADRDSSGAYDGNWQANVLKSPTKQYGPGNWTFNCSGKPQQFSFSVNSGQAAVNYQKTSHKAYVDKDGKFRFEIPMNVSTSAAGTSDGSIDRGAMTMIIVGALKANSGRITYGIEQFANQGCTASINYSRAS